MTKEMIETAVTRYAEEAKEAFGPKLHRVILYGSCARGDYDDESDIDIMTILDVPREKVNDELEKSIDISSRIDEEFDYDILLSPVVQSKDIFYRYKDVLPFYMNVIKEGKVYA